MVGPLPTLDQGAWVQSRLEALYRGCATAKNLSIAWEIFLFQLSAKAPVATLCFALHWHCFLFLYTKLHYHRLFF